MTSGALAVLLAALACPRAWGLSRGEVEVLGLKGPLVHAGYPVKKGDIVKAKAPFYLGERGKAVLRLADGLVLLKGPASFRPDSDGATLGWGRLLTLLKPRHKPWRVSSPTAVAAVRGTEFYLHSPKEGGPDYLCLCRGFLRVTPAAAPKAEPLLLETESHEASRLQAKGGSLAQSPAGFEGHTDEELASLRGLLRED